MKYELTKDMETGHPLIDMEHRQLFSAINNLMDACAQGKGRAQIINTTKFLNDYVKKHFHDEEQLQIQSKYPGFTAHKQFHDKYKIDLAQITNTLNVQGANLATLNQVNQIVGILVTHIRMEDKKLAAHVKNSK